MTGHERIYIEKISKEFAKGLGIKVAGSGWLIVDPLSAYLNFCGYENTVFKLEPTKNTPLILMITFKGGETLIPAGSDTKIEHFRDWHWIDHSEIDEIKALHTENPCT